MSENPLRREQRLPYRTRVKVRCDSWERVVALYTHNISRGGMFLRTENPPVVGSRVMVQLALPDGRVLEMPAQVAHVVSPERARADERAPGMGVVFEPIEAAQREVLEDILEGASTPGPVVDPAPESAPPPAEPAPKAAPEPAPASAASVPAAAPEASPAEEELALLDEEGAKLLAALEAELGRLRELRPWEVLGVAADAPEDEAALAYRRLCKHYHPDVFAHWRAPEVRGAASDCFIVVKKAYERISALRKVRARSSLIPRATPRPVNVTPPSGRPPPMPPAALRSRVAPAAPEAPVPEAVPVSRSAPVVVGPPPPPAGVGRTPARAFHIPSALDPGVGRAGSPSRPVTTAARSQSETFQLVVPPPASEVADEMGSFAPVAPNLDAQELFGDLAPTPPPQPVPHMIAPARPAGTGAAEEGLALLAQRRFGEARTRLAEALRREPRNRAIRISYHLCVGYDLRSQGRDDDARKQFESVLVLDPQNSEAVAALRSQSVEKREQRRGFLRKILDRD